MTRKSEMSKEMNLEDGNEVKITLKHRAVLLKFALTWKCEESWFFTLAEDSKLHQE